MSASRARGLARLGLTVGVFAVIAVLFMGSKYGVIFGGIPSYPHYLQTVVPSAFEVIPGERMVAGGETVGEITKANVTKSGQAHIVMGLDNSVWPVPADTILTLRMGGTIKYTDRFINITKGRSGTVFQNNAVVPARQFIVPVEYGQLFDVFNKPTRAAMKSFFSNGGQTFSQAAQPFHSALNVAAPVLNQGAAVFRDLGYDQHALSTLVSSTAQVSDAVASSNPGIQTLIQSAANTFGSVAQESTSLKRLVQTTGRSLYVQGVLYYHVGRILYPLARLARNLEPGVNQLSQLATPLDQTLREVVNVEPTAVHTLTTVKTQGSTIDRLLTSARTTLLPELSAIGPLAAKELNCIRPYTPDIIGFLQGWSGFLGVGENSPKINFLHSYISILPLPNATPMNTAQAHTLLPALGTEYVGVPGTSWNQPWYQPQCGTTADVFNPAHDINNNTYDPVGSKLAPYPSTSK
jgi:phospholipid/cholesterol/gamma-HCH transport system substrate-binding protein